MDTEEIRRMLQTKKEELEKRLLAIEEDKERKKDPLVSDLDDQAIQRENDPVIDALDETLRQELRQIEHALYRLDMGNYHICSHCGEIIGEERRKALPYTTLCIRCAHET